MGDIRSLLNPLEDVNPLKNEESNLSTQIPAPKHSEINEKASPRGVIDQLPSPCSTTYTRDTSSQPHSRKKLKISKDAAVFTRGTIRGECRYPPDEFRDELLAANHQQYEIYPMGDIANYPRHIPYNSEKKTFLEKTGRECFEVFHYNFKVPGYEKMHCMMWDYNIGLVRTTPLFKCTGHSKTTPAKMLNRNIGLREICHSITGGALVAQGYWMPYEAAKAIAATFCWNIRYALTPVFGHDFPSECTRPGSETFGDMIIDDSIIRRCAQQAREYRAMEQSTTCGVSAMPSPITPQTPSFPRFSKSLRPKATPAHSPASGYSTDLSHDESYSLSSATPTRTPQSRWTHSNTPRSHAHFDSRLPSPRSILAGIRRGEIRRQKKTASKLSSPALSPKSRRSVDVDQDYDGDSSSDSSSAGLRQSRKKSASMVPSDEKAAFLLMSLRLEKEIRHREPRGIKRRASA